MDATRYNHSLVWLDEETIVLVFDVLEDCSYKRLKEQLIKRLSGSEAAKSNHLLMELIFCDRAPSKPLCEIKQIGDEKVCNELLQSLRLQTFSHVRIRIWHLKPGSPTTADGTSINSHRL